MVNFRLKGNPHVCELQEREEETTAPESEACISSLFHALCARLVVGSQGDIRDLEAALQTLWVLQDYLSKSRNSAAYTAWLKGAHAAKRDAMLYFVKLPVSRYPDFRLSMAQYETMLSQAKAGAGVAPAQTEQDRDALATDVTRAVCACLNV